jgi:hypothetical protein
MSDPILPRDRFEALVGAYGARPARWPAEHREAMRQAAEQPWARALMAEAAAADALLDAAPVFGDHVRLFDRAVAAAPRALGVTRLWRRLAGIGVAAALAGAGATGLAVGVAIAPQAAVLNGVQTVSNDDPLQDAAGWMQEQDVTGAAG